MMALKILAVATVAFNGVDTNDFLYRNDGNTNHWITIKLIGTTTNKSAIGTKIRVKATINGSTVWQMRGNFQHKLRITDKTICVRISV